MRVAAVAGRPTTRIRIKDYQFRPGHRLLFDKAARVPVVPRGRSLTFVNQDDTR